MRHAGNSGRGWSSSTDRGEALRKIELQPRPQRIVASYSEQLVRELFTPWVQIRPVGEETGRGADAVLDTFVGPKS